MGQASEAHLAATQAFLKRAPNQPALAAAFRTWRAEDNRSMSSLGHDDRLMAPYFASGLINPLLAGPAIKSAHAAVLRFRTRMVAAARLPLPECYTRLTALQQEVKAQPWLARQVLEEMAIERIAMPEMLLLAQLRCAVAALAAERYRLRHGRWPQRLDQLTPQFLSEVPADPFTGAPLRCTSKDGKFMIYSVGPDGKNGASVIDEPRYLSPDAVHLSFILWDASQRRQPP
jgi:hypothetical protein